MDGFSASGDRREVDMHDPGGRVDGLANGRAYPLRSVGFGSRGKEQAAG